MPRRRPFVPGNPAATSLEGRIAPSVGGWFSHTFKQIGDAISPHHKSQDAAAGIAQLWKDSAKLSRPIHTAPAHPAAHAAK